jgi:hypothetical protein
MRALSLVANRQVELANLIVTKRASIRVQHVPERRVVAKPSALGTASKSTHAVGSRQRELLVGSLDDVGALVHRRVGDDGVDASAHRRLGLGSLAGAEVVPRVVGDVVGATRLVDVEEVDFTPVGGDLLAEVVAARGHGPVGDAVGVYVAAEDADGGTVDIVGSDASSGDGSDDGEGGGDGGEHVEF